MARAKELMGGRILQGLSGEPWVAPRMRLGMGLAMGLGGVGAINNRAAAGLLLLLAVGGALRMAGDGVDGRGCGLLESTGMRTPRLGGPETLIRRGFDVVAPLTGPEVGAERVVGAGRMRNRCSAGGGGIAEADIRTGMHVPGASAAGTLVGSGCVGSAEPSRPGVLMA